ncbi:hypothetical protein NLA06_04480 [Desulfomicrobium sp. ZS1]|jgi:hypothetical protein|uniref:hypothetical protein n=1 Tax=Desulfomicrobium sp. ZS1 TaxID=2952228 RepID=UPI0020B3D2DC|nr:hypothetical protein [Desulfomicrobium sp. ZS1]UTF51159.1 hypothetical protein NLA06_04480 [Desulfomicrobium sp. ZS1]
MTENQIQAGSSVESLCKKCKTVTDHHVVVMAGEKIAKVECKVCNARHAYVSPTAEPKVKKPATPRPKKAALASTKQALALAEQWEKLVTPCAKPLTYSMERTFQIGDVIDHPTFGLGYVQKLMKPCTAEIQFKDAIRNMRCGTFK